MVALRFIELAKLINQIMSEGIYLDCPDFEMPYDVIELTASALEHGYNSGDYTEDENGMLYYSGMVDDYGGFFEKEYEKQLINQLKNI